MNGIIIIDKPEDWTSHDVVGKLRGLLHERRIGHGGTLDPMATGVLPVFVGRATRAVEFCESAEKEYIAGLRLGVTTDTQDTTGQVTATSEKTATRADVAGILMQFTGIQQQIPPMYSAVKIGGKKLYEIARKGGEVERKPRTIEIKALELLPEETGDMLLRVVCSKGTYIRTLCHDIGQTLGCGGVMSSLRRVRAGSFGIGDAVTLAQVADACSKNAAENMLRPVDSLFSDYPEFTVSADDERKCRCGAAVKAIAKANGRYRVYSPKGEFLLLADVKNETAYTVKSFFEVDSHE